MVGEFFDDVADDEEGLPESDAIATEFDEEFEKANVGVEGAQGAEDVRKISELSLQQRTLQSSLRPQQAPKGVDVEGQINSDFVD